MQLWRMLLMTWAWPWLSTKSRRRPSKLTTRTMPSRKSMASLSGSIR
jgi:hypothetical protein